MSLFRKWRISIIIPVLINFCSFPVRVLPLEENVDVDFPPMLDSDDISFFFENRDLDGLEWALKNVFKRSERNPDLQAVVHPLPEQLISRGGGLTYTTAYKMRHDLEQAEYLADNLQDDNEASFFRTVVAPAYRSMIERIPPLDQLERTHGLYQFSAADRAATQIHTLYSKALYPTNVDTLKDHDTGKPIPLVNPNLDFGAIQRQWSGQDAKHKHPGIVVVDNILSAPAMEAIQKILFESTVWYQTKTLKYGGYVGAYIDDGLHDRILLDLAMELHDSMSEIFRGHALKYLWAYKYDSNYTGIKLHADQAAVNVNLWLTPDEANLNKDSGGLVIFTAKPPSDWDFKQFNTDTELVRQQLLEPTGYANVTVPYKLNRAVIFDSALFHQTDNFQFREGYKNRRINLTLLYGDMQPSQQINNKQEL
jgi:hypothetical protein